MMPPLKFVLRLFLIALVPMALVLPALAFAPDGQRGDRVNLAARQDSAATVTVTMREGAFNPSTVSVKAGARIKWVNADDRDYSLASSNKVLATFKSGTIKRNGSWTFTVPSDLAAGNYAYACKLRPRAKGTIRVE